MFIDINLCHVILENFSPEDIGEPILDVILEAGDLLYFPRGCVHQVCRGEIVNFYMS